ncbi:hypothetical protein [Lachnoanaerobaculum umeaense]|uniref:N4-gp56 family major capsid protein n=1 Tax=Lachnoanaerobaculum umeaense TaxID=617123 RepID=A0A385PYS3_9FIRM|nr:hypothetical protein [Lachnoanaerobaculum umeaense]AYA98880.1 hypothetical protein D4A81_02420 [Lachnoanaerobaculum umeaense]AYA99321.1 hypothetical protein D4A81_04845 [Lachnoanaerobaculum umeaense]PZW90673.1 hypothetical protein C7439_1612 [Lachnoanaerobaculum umeaense]
MANTINLATKYLPYVDELFTNESKRELVTNNDFTWDGAHTVKVYKVTTSLMNDYDRSGEKVEAGQIWSRYGVVKGLDATTEEMTLKKDRSFTFAIDRLDINETAGQLAAQAALARQIRQVVIPEIDGYVYKVMCDNAGIKETNVTLTKENIYDKIIEANSQLDDVGVPEFGRVLIMTPATYVLLKKNKDVTINQDVGQELRVKGVVGVMDGLGVQKIPANRLPDKFGFMIAHSVATVAPVKLTDYKIHDNPPGISGNLVEGRIAYDAFVLDNKAKAIYYLQNK